MVNISHLLAMRGRGRGGAERLPSREELEKELLMRVRMIPTANAQSRRRLHLSADTASGPSRITRHSNILRLLHSSPDVPRCVIAYSIPRQMKRRVDIGGQHGPHYNAACGDPPPRATRRGRAGPAVGAEFLDPPPGRPAAP